MEFLKVENLLIGAFEGGIRVAKRDARGSDSIEGVALTLKPAGLGENVSDSAQKLRDIGTRENIANEDVASRVEIVLQRIGCNFTEADVVKCLHAFSTLR